jgi:hypothetical protein
VNHWTRRNPGKNGLYSVQYIKIYLYNDILN